MALKPKIVNGKSIWFIRNLALNHIKLSKLNAYMKMKVPNQPHPFPWTCTISAQADGCFSAVVYQRNKIMNLEHYKDMIYAQKHYYS